MNDSERYVCVADIKKKFHSVMNSHVVYPALRKDILNCFKKVPIHFKGEFETTIEAEPVVRCKDCVYCGKKINEQQRECKFWMIEIIPSKDYCSRYCKVGGADNA